MTKPIKRYIDLVYGTALRRPGAIAIVCGEERLTFGQVHKRAAYLGAALRKLGLIAGDRVALLAENELQYLEIQAACLRSGFTLVPLNTRLTYSELEYIIEDCTPALIIGGQNYAETVRHLGRKCGIDNLYSTAENGIVSSYRQLLDLAVPDPDADPTDNDLNALILYTSGTTGHPKGATINRMAFSARVMGNAMEMEVAQDDVLLQNLPLFHISAFLFYAYLFRGARCILLPGFDPVKALDLMQKEAVTATNGVPTVITMLLEAPNIETYDPSLLRLITYGGAAIEPSLLRKAIAKFACGFQQHYGMTEAGSACILKAQDHNPDDTGALSSAGCDAAGYEIRIVDEAGKHLANGESGEIILRGAGLMTGYWGHSEKTAESILNGWFHTGDIGYRDTRNFLHVIDRRNDMIISGGENIYPREIEAILEDHPSMPDAAIIGLPNPKWGEVVCCVLREDAPSEQVLEDWLRERIAGYKMPRRWFRLPELPRNVTGKVLKVQLRKQFGGR